MFAGSTAEASQIAGFWVLPDDGDGDEMDDRRVMVTVWARA